MRNTSSCFRYRRSKNIVVDNETGYVLPTEDPQVWTDRLTKLAALIKNNDENYKQLCLKSRRHVIEEFDVHRILENYVSNDEDEGNNNIVDESLQEVS